MGLLKFIASALTATILLSGCGSSAREHAGGVTTSAKIFNGVAINEADLPFVRPLYFLTPSSLRFICTGTMISPMHYLTAAHCITESGGATPNYAVDVGEGRLVRASGVAIHPAYAGIGAADIAIILLSEPYDGAVAPTLESLLPFPGTETLIAGYGDVGNGVDDGVTLRAGTTTIEQIDFAAGAYAWQQDSFTESNTCPGDSGGPAFVAVNGTLAVAGITSGGSANCEMGGVSINTLVPTFLNFIYAITGGAHART